MPKQLTPEEMEAAADALVGKYQEGDLTEDDTELVDADTIGEIGSLEEAQAGEPAKTATDKEPKKKEGEDELGGDDDGTQDPNTEGKEDEPGEGADNDGDAPSDGADPEGGDTEGDDGKGLSKSDEGRVKNAQHRMHQATTKAADLDRENQALRSQLAQVGGGGGARAPRKEIDLSRNFEGMTTEELNTLKEDYPGLAKFVGVVGGLQDENDRLRESLGTLEGDVEDSTRTSSESRWISAIKDKHPDIETIQHSEDFKGWAERQPRYIQQAIYESGTVDDMVEIIGSYKDEFGITSPSKEVVTDPSADTGTTEPTEKEKKLAQAKAVSAPNLSKPARQHKPGKGKSETISQSQIAAFRNDMQNKTPEEIEAFDAKIDKAMAEGRVTPD